MLNEKNTLMLIIDIQEKLLNATFNKNIIDKNISILAQTSKLLDIPTIITEQYPKGLGSTVSLIKNNLNNDAIFYEKMDFNALTNNEIDNLLKIKNKKNILIFGIETHICVYQTIQDLLSKNYNVTVIIDACGSRSEFEHKNGLNNIKDLGAKVKTTEMVVFELLKSAKHPKFKEIQALIK